MRNKEVAIVQGRISERLYRRSYRLAAVAGLFIGAAGTTTGLAASGAFEATATKP